MIARSMRILKRFAQAESKTAWLEDRLAWKLFLLRLRRERRINEAFDRKYGTDTAAEIPLESAGVPADETARGNGLYRPFWESNFRAALAELRIDFTGYTFVDIGSGKGKLLLLASDYPFRRIIGVEYAPLLHETALNNVKIYRGEQQKCSDIRPILGDAISYTLPAGPVVCIIFNALDPATTILMLHRLDMQTGGERRPVFVVYANLRRVSEIGRIFDGLEHLRVLLRSRAHVVLGNARGCEEWRHTSQRQASQLGLRRKPPAPSRPAQC